MYNIHLCEYIIKINPPLTLLRHGVLLHEGHVLQAPALGEGVGILFLCERECVCVRVRVVGGWGGGVGVLLVE